MSLFTKVFGDPNAKVVKNLQTGVALINGFEPAVSVLSDEALAAKTIEFKDRLAKGETLESVQHEAFAVVREAA